MGEGFLFPPPLLLTLPRARAPASSLPPRSRCGAAPQRHPQPRRRCGHAHPQPFPPRHALALGPSSKRTAPGRCLTHSPRPPHRPVSQRFSLLAPRAVEPSGALAAGVGAEVMPGGSAYFFAGLGAAVGLAGLVLAAHCCRKQLLSAPRHREKARRRLHGALPARGAPAAPLLVRNR